MADPAGEAPRLSRVAYDELVLDRRYGPFDEVVDAALADATREEIGDVIAGQQVPPAVFPILFLKALRRAFGGIPAGSVLAKQELEFRGPMAVGETAWIETWVGSKYERRGRRYAVLEFDVRNHDRDPVLTGRKYIVWPAPRDGS